MNGKVLSILICYNYKERAKKEMKKEIAKKTIILYVLKMLYYGTNEGHPITITNMTKVLNSMNIPCDRKTVGRNINYIIEFGLPVIKLKKGYYYDHSKGNTYIGV